MRVRLSVAVLLLACFLWSPSAAWAQQPAQTQSTHIADASALRDAVVKKVAADSEKRRQVLALFEHSDARAMAERMGLSMQRAETAVAQLSGEELTQLAASAAQAESQLAGGQRTIVISVTTLLLIIIIVLLIAN